MPSVHGADNTSVLYVQLYLITDLPHIRSILPVAPSIYQYAVLLTDRPDDPSSFRMISNTCDSVDLTRFSSESKNPCINQSLVSVAIDGSYLGNDRHGEL